MKRLLALTMLACTLGGSTAWAQDWTVVGLGTTADILDIQQSSFSWRWITGSDGFAAQSFDRVNWTPANVGTVNDLVAMHEPSSGQVWMGGESGVVRRKVGDSWQNYDIATAESVYLFSRSSGTSWAAGDGGTVFRSTNAGVDWQVSYAGAAPLHAGSGFINGPAYVVGDGGLILKTTDAGVNWQVLPTGTTENLHAFLESGGAIFAAGTNGTVMRSTDVGASWSTIPTGTSATLHDLGSSAQSANWMLAVGTGGTILRSTNLGLTWCQLSADVTTDLYAVDMVINSEYLVGGAGGLLLRTTTSGGSCRSPSSAPDWIDPPASLLVARPYPNPMRGAGFVELAAGSRGLAHLEVMDLNGRRVTPPLRRYLQPGRSESVELEIGALPVGVYYLRVSLGDEAQSHPIVVVR